MPCTVLNYLNYILCLIFSVFNTLYLNNLHWILASCIYNIGTIGKSYCSQGATVAVLVFFFFNRKRKVFVAEETSDLHKRELLKYHEYFPILVFEGSLSIEIAL